ncbi:putative membrane protein [Pseudohyphozyma bogoriensis]|nr:putative membrane protein [Pseudohyphozyma bogoriensis]
MSSSGGGTDRSASPAANYSLSVSSKRRVVTTPSWARNLPPEFPSDDEDDNVDGSRSRASSSAPRVDRRRTLSSVLRPPTQTPQNQPNPHEGNSEASTSSSTNPFFPAIHVQKPEDAHKDGEVERGGGGGPSSSAAAAGPSTLGASPGSGDRWWTFTLPSKYLVKVQDYVNSGTEKEKGTGGDETNEKTGEGDEAVGMTMDARLSPPNVFSANQALTPSWSSPWTPFRRESTRHDDLFHELHPSISNQTQPSKLENFLLHNPFAPLVLRFINLCLNTATLALVCHIRIQESNASLIGVIGSSTLMAIIVTPIAMVHIFINVYIEYFGRPIGIWTMRSKMMHTLSELIFICFYSSILSLAFDDLFTSSLECTSWTPYSQFSSPPISAGSSKVEGTLADKICGQQVALVTLLFLSVILYIGVMVVSLLRIMGKVSRKH